MNGKNVFEVTDKTGRKILLTKKQWDHITTTHAEMSNYLDEIKITLENPLKIIEHSIKEDLRFYYRYQKHRKHPEKYLKIIVKYLNGDGFVITAQFVRNIK
jgi:hypothetical protein